MRCIGRHRFQRLGHDFVDLLVSDLARRTAARFVIEAIEALFGKPLPPQSDRQPGDAELIRDRAIIHAVRGQQHDLGSHCIGPCDLSATHAHFQLATLAVAEYDLHCWAVCHRRLQINPMGRGNHGLVKVTRNF
jgi:hypothetical protein